MTHKPIVYPIIRAIWIGEIGPRVNPKLPGPVLRHFGVHIPFREALVVDGVYMVSAEPLSSCFAPIAIGWMTLAKDVHVPGRSRWIRLSIQYLILAYKSQLDTSKAPGVLIGIAPVSFLLRLYAQRIRRSQEQGHACDRHEEC